MQTRQKPILSPFFGRRTWWLVGILTTVCIFFSGMKLIHMWLARKNTLEWKFSTIFPKIETIFFFESETFLKMEKNAGTKTQTVELCLALIFKFLRFCLLNRFHLQVLLPDFYVFGVFTVSVNIRAEGCRIWVWGCDYGKKISSGIKKQRRENDIKMKKPHARPHPANGKRLFDNSRLAT